MGRWLIKLTGEREDLEEFHRLFSRRDANVIEEGGAFYLTGVEFESLADTASDAAKVQARAAEVIAEMFPVVSLNWRLARRPEVGTIVFRENANGGRDVIVSVGTAHLRGRGMAAFVSNAPEQAGPTEAEQMLAAIQKPGRLQSVARLWSDPHRSWSHLFIIYEELREYLGKEPDTAGLCTKDARERFTQSAQPHRHGADKKYQPPKKPMSLQEATDFILELMGHVLRMP
jgi:hypothetical protein